ncbi:MAG: carboxypeptidase regulatory-like domain-containing protein [Acidobacteria bacterium]|nr:carboxypeptidase regulatory-like domain-containing protein [Acidobacteriota bacterium]
MKIGLLVLVLGVGLSACGSQSSPSPTAPTPTSATRVIGLTGTLAFGELSIGQKGTAILTITNTGNTALTVTGMTVPVGSMNVYTFSFASGTVLAGGSQLVAIQFAPTAAVSYDGILTVNGDATSGTNTISISGTGSGLVSLTGVVRASDGLAVNAATVTVVDGPNAGRTTTTANGVYRFDNLIVGNANLSVNAAGYASAADGVYIDGVSTLDFTLLPPPIVRGV